MLKQDLLQRIRPYLEAIFLTGYGPNETMVQGFIDQYSPLETNASDLKYVDHLLAIHADMSLEKKVRDVATYLLQDVCNHPADPPIK